MEVIVIKRRVLAIHLHGDNNLATLKLTYIRYDSVVFSSTRAPGQVVGPRVFDTTNKLISHALQNLLNGLIKHQFSNHPLTVRENHVTPFVVTMIRIQMFRKEGSEDACCFAELFNRELGAFSPDMTYTA
jgi:hypothetical protein